MSKPQSPDAVSPTAAPAVDRALIARLARLARLTVDADEESRLTAEMASILTYVQKLEELDVRDVPPTSHAVDLPTKLRPDAARQGLPVEQALKNAPERIGDGFGVPKIIE